MSASVSWFEIPATDPQKLATFYHSAFGWNAQQYPGMQYFILDTKSNGAGIKGAITQRGELQSTAPTLYVPSIDDAISKVAASGGRIVTEKVSIPDVGTMVYAADPEGNVFGMLQQATK
jgi:predicted enzyme related to lactoylglutathione lyase